MGTSLEGNARLVRRSVLLGVPILALVLSATAFAQTLSLLNSGPDGGPLLGSDPFRFRVSGTPSNTYVVEGSGDLAHWTPVYTNLIPSAGYFDFVESETGRFPRRFYRAVSLSESGPLGGLLEGFRNDRVLVRPKSGVVLSVLAQLHTLLGTQVLQSYPRIGDLQVLHVPGTASVSDVISFYRRSGLVEYAEPDYRVQSLLAPNDFRYSDGSLWGLHNTGAFGGTPGADISAPAAWEIRNTANNIIVAILDTGVRATHEDLAGNIWVNPDEIPGNGIDDDGNGVVDDVHGLDALNNTGDPTDDHGHGTHVSGIIGGVGDNSVGVVGVCWNVQLMACRFLDSAGTGFISDAIRCMDYARSKGAKVVNASWGSTSFTSAALHDGIDSLRQAGILFVAAAGNSSDDNDVNPLYPASYELDNIISVAATTRTDELAFFSNYGATAVDLGAPGAAIFSCWNNSDSDYRYNDGTSMAAPHVAGACALLLAHFPNDNYRQIIDRLLSSVDPLPGLLGKCRAGGRMNVQKALSGGSPPPQRPTVTILATDADASEEGADTAAFTISRVGDTSAALTVNYTLGGTAQDHADFQPMETLVTIEAGASSAAVTVTPIDDTEIEDDETVVLTIVSDEAYEIGSPGIATVTIVDNDEPSPKKPTITAAATDADASEEKLDMGTFTISRTGSTEAALTVHFSLGGSADNGIDYQSLPTSVTIPAGAATANVTVRTVDDDEVEAEETVELTLTAEAAYTVGSPDLATISIRDNDKPPPSEKPTVTVAAADLLAAESGTDPGSFTVSRTGSTATSLTVRYSLGGTAQNGSDYQTLSGSVTIAAGASSANAIVLPIDDRRMEIAELVILTLTTDDAYNVGLLNTATVTILDNDVL